MVRSSSPLPSIYRGDASRSAPGVGGSIAPAPARSPAASRLPSLDGIRALSILLVLAQHVAGQAGFRWLAPVVRRADVGHLGVRVFFVLSGFLISTLLLREHARTGTVSLRQFYWRRFWRIAPPYYAYLGVMSLVTLAGGASIDPRSVAAAAVYVTNYVGGHAWVGHTWSLSVEEQFYLLWPALLVLAGPRRGVRIGLGLAVAAALARPALDGLAGWPATRWSFEGNVDALLVGCVLAYARDQLWTRPAWRAFVRSPGLPLLGGALLVQFALPFGRSYRLGIGALLLNVGIALGVEWCLRTPDGRVGRVLNWRPLAFLGTLSYSVYLWQQPLTMGVVPALGPLGTVPGSLVVVGACALLSYYAIERPALRWRDRLGGTTRRGAPHAGWPIVRHTHRRDAYLAASIFQSA